MHVHVIPAMRDNYIYLAVDERQQGVVIDPGCATTTLSALAAHSVNLQAILITHRHADHIGGLAAVCAAHPAAVVHAPDGCGIPVATICGDGDSLSLLDGALKLRVAATPGHTLEHIAYIGDRVLFCGDTLFVGGCGRVVAGGMRQMHNSLNTLAALADDTTFYCGHEYTLANLRFAAAVEPDNSAIHTRLQTAQRQRAAGAPTVPGVLANERMTNPFLRLTEPAVVEAVRHRLGRTPEDSVAVFTALREWKNSF